MIYSNKPIDTQSDPLLDNPDKVRPEESTQGEIFSTSADSALRANSIIGGYWNLQEAYDTHLNFVKGLTGEEVPENPYSHWMVKAYPPEMLADWEAYKAEGGDQDLGPGHRQGFYRSWIEKNFRKQMGEIAKKHPEYADKILPEQSFVDKSFDIRHRSELAEQKTWERAPDGSLLNKSLLSYGSAFAGGMWGAAQDPINIVTLPLGVTGAGWGAKALVIAALKAGGINAAIEAGIQPFVQSDRAEAGMDYGWDQAAVAVGSAFAFGAVVDGGVRAASRFMRGRFGYVPHIDGGIVVGWRPEGAPEPGLTQGPQVPPELRERLRKGGDPEAEKELAAFLEQNYPDTIPANKVRDAIVRNDDQAIREIADKTGLTKDPEFRQALDTSEADLLTQRKPSQDILDSDHTEAMTQAIRHAENPEFELPVTRIDETPRADVSAAVKDAAEAASRSADIDIGALDPRIRAAIEEATGLGQDDVIALIKTLSRQGLDPDRSLRVLEAVRSDDPIRLAQNFRERPDLVSDALPVSGGTLSRARDLARLSDTAFEAATSGRIENGVALGQVVGRHVSDQTIHSRLMDDLAAREPKNEEQAKLALAELLHSPDYNKVDGDLANFREVGGKKQIDDPNGPDARQQIAKLERDLAEELGAKTVAEEPSADPIRSAPEPELVKAVDQVAQLREAVRQAIGVTPEELGVVVRSYSNISELPGAYRADAERAKGEALANAILRFEAATTKAERQFFRDRLDDLSSGRGSVFGFMNPRDGLPPEVWVATYAANAKATVAHEFVHALRNLGKITDEEIAVLARRGLEIGAFMRSDFETYRSKLQARDLSAKEIDRLLEEEAAAHLIEAYFAGHSIAPHAPSMTILQRISDLLARVKKALRKSAPETTNEVTAESVIQAFQSGEIARRELTRRAMDEHGIVASHVTQDANGGVTMHSIVGTNALDHNDKVFMRAEDMALSGIPRGRIYNETGFFLDPTGKWVREVSDHTARINELQFDAARVTTAEQQRGVLVKKRIGDVIQNDPLFAAYPGLKRIAFANNRNIAPGNAVYYSNAGLIPELRDDYPAGIAVGPKSPASDKLSILHELGHASQTAGGMANGGVLLDNAVAVGDLADALFGSKPLTAFGRSKREEALLLKAARISLDGFRGNSLPSLRAHMRDMMKSGQLTADAADMILGDMQAHLQFEIYKNLPGEVMARMIETRANMTPQERRARPPWMDYDVPEEFIFGTQPKKPDPRLIFSIDERVGQSMKRDLDNLSMFSPALEAARRWNQNKGTPDQIRSLLSKGVTQAELRAYKLDAFLKDKKSVSKEELVKYMTDNRPSLTEHTRRNLGDLSERYDELPAYEQDLLDQEALSAMYGDSFKWLSKDEQQRVWDSIFPEEPGGETTKFAWNNLDEENPTSRETVYTFDEFQDRQVAEMEADLASFRQQMPERDGPELQAFYEKLFDREDALRTLKDKTIPKSQHFTESEGYGGYMGHLMTSLTKVRGESGFLVDQIQSDAGQSLRDAIRTAYAKGLFDKEFKELSPEERAAVSKAIAETPVEARAAKTDLPTHPLIETTENWVNFLARRSIIQAVNADAKYLIIPHGDTVLSYNPAEANRKAPDYGDGMREFYGTREMTGMVPKNVRKILQAIDRDLPAPERIEAVETTKGERGFKPRSGLKFNRDQTGFTVFPLTDKIRDEVRSGGLRMMSINQVTDRDIGRSMRQDVDQLGYFSAALRAAQAWPQAKGTPEQALTWLKKSGVKDAEIEATKLKEFLQTDEGWNATPWLHGSRTANLKSLKANQPTDADGAPLGSRGVYVTTATEDAKTHARGGTVYQVQVRGKIAPFKYAMEIPRSERVEKLQAEGYVGYHETGSHSQAVVFDDSNVRIKRGSITRDDLIAHLQANRVGLKEANYADYIAIPSGDTVLSYNPGDTDGMRGFYDGIVPKNLLNILRKLDKASSDPIKVDQVETPTKGMAGNGFTVFPLTDTVKAKVREDGQALVSINERSGLDNSKEARMKRAEEMGFDTSTVWYHGTAPTGWNFKDGDVRFEGTDFDQFRPGSYFASSPEYASGFAQAQANERSLGNLPRVIPVYLKMKNPYRADDLNYWRTLRANPQSEESRLRALGYDGIILKELPDDDRMAGDVAYVFDPRNIRSVNADFDPAKSDDPNLMFALNDKSGRPKFGAKDRAEALQMDFAEINDEFAKFAAANKGRTEELRQAKEAKEQAVRAKLLNAKAEEDRLDDMAAYKNTRGQGDKALALLLMHESSGTEGGAMDVRHLHDAISKAAIGMMDKLTFHMRKGAITGDKRRVWNKRLRADMEDVISEAAGVASGNPLAKEFAKSWMDTAEYLRQYFNAVGGNIKKLEGWYAPQFHDADALYKAGPKIWVDYMMKDGVLDRDRMLNFNGEKLTDAELRALLRQSWTTITTNGLNKVDPSQASAYGKGALYKRHQEHRVLHFKDHKAWLTYNKEFGGGDVFAAMVGHIDLMTKEIAAMDRFGANPEVVRERLKMHVRKEAAMAMAGRSIYDDLSDQVDAFKLKLRGGPSELSDIMDRIGKVHDALDAERFGKGRKDPAKIEALNKELFGLHEEFRNKAAPAASAAEAAADFKRISDLMDEMAALEKYPIRTKNAVARAEWLIQRSDEAWKMYNGTTNTPTSSRIAAFMAGSRNWVMSSALSGASISSLSDFTNQLAARRFIGMPVVGQLTEYLKAFTPADRKAALAEGLGLDSARVAFAERARYVGWFNTRHITGYLADRTHAFSMLSPMTQAQKTSFGRRFLTWIPSMRDVTWANLDPDVRSMFERHHFSPVEWDQLRAIDPIMDNGTPKLTHALIEKEVGTDLANHFMIMLFREQGVSTVDATLRGRSLWLSESKPGTVAGEILRTAAMIKSFPTSYTMQVINRGYQEILAGRWGSAGAYGAAVFFGGTLMGAMAMQLKNIAYGRDPEDMTKTAFWVKAFMQSGGVGIFGDFVGSSVNRFGGGLAQTLGGPMAGRASTLLDLTVGNVIQFGSDEKSNVGREFVRALRENTPGAFVPFYLRTAYERLLLDELQRLIDPDANASFRAKERGLKRRSGQEFYWGPGKRSPRDINWGAAVGAQ